MLVQVHTFVRSALFSLLLLQAVSAVSVLETSFLAFDSQPAAALAVMLARRCIHLCAAALGCHILLGTSPPPHLFLAAPSSSSVSPLPAPIVLVALPVDGLLLFNCRVCSSVLQHRL